MASWIMRHVGIRTPERKFRYGSSCSRSSFQQNLYCVWEFSSSGIAYKGRNDDHLGETGWKKQCGRNLSRTGLGKHMERKRESVFLSSSSILGTSTFSGALCLTGSRNNRVVSESSALANRQTVQWQVFTMNTYVRNPRRQVYFSQGYSEKENLSTTPTESKIGKYGFNLYQIFLYQHGFLNKTTGVPAFFFKTERNI